MFEWATWRIRLNASAIIDVHVKGSDSSSPQDEVSPALFHEAAANLLRVAEMIREGTKPTAKKGKPL